MHGWEAVAGILGIIVCLGIWPMVLLIIGTHEKGTQTRALYAFEFAGAWGLAVTVVGATVIFSILRLAHCHASLPARPLQPLSSFTVGAS
jgi:hypothetical protein